MELSRYESLKKPKAWSAEAFGEGGYTVVPPEEEEDYRRRAIRNAIALRPGMMLKLVSGGQTGVDQGALEAAIDLGLDYGGWVPKGWKTEEGPLDKRYREKMREHASDDYKQRTRQNVVDSHATLILVDALPLSGGTLLTKRYCENGHSHFVIAMNEPSAVEKVQKWLRAFFTEDYPTPFVLNVAGPRESKSLGIQARTRRFVAEVIRTM